MISPPLLQAGDRVALVAPAGKMEPAALQSFYDTLDAWGLQVEAGKHLFAGSSYLAAPDHQRLADLQRAFDNPDIKAVFCARGGYGSGRLLPALDYKNLLQHPKWLIGFSDITALLMALENKGLAAIHGPVGTTFGGADQEVLQALYELLFKGSTRLQTTEATAIKAGEVQAPVTGGNLALVTDSLATPAEVDTRGKILILEEVGEPLYRIDRMLQQLKRAGKLAPLAGLLIGKVTAIPTDSTFDYSLKEIIVQLTTEYDYPVVMDFPVGHVSGNYPFVTGGLYTLTARAGQVVMTGPNGA